MTSPSVPTVGSGARRPAVLAAGAALAVAALSWSVVGAAGTAVLAGAWLLAYAVGRLVPALSGPAAWAVGVVAELALVVGISTVLGTLAAGRHPALVQSAVLAVPVVLGAALLAVSWRSRGRRRPGGAEPLPSRWPVALLITAGGLVGFAALALLGRYYDVAWAMGGDARNHARMARELLGDGGMTLEFLRSAPAGANAFTAILAGAGGRDVAAGHLLLDDANALADTYVRAAIAGAAMLAAAGLESRPRAARAARLTLPTAGVVLIAGAGAVAPLLLGTTLADGFMSAYVVIALVLAALVLGLRTLAEPRALPVAVPLLVVATGLTLATWPVVVVLPMALLVLVTVVRTAPAGVAAPASRSNRAARLLAAVSVVGMVGVLVVSWASLRSAFGLPGAIAPPAGWLLPALLLVAAAVALAPWARTSSPGPDDEPTLRRVLAVPVVVGAAGAVTVLGLRVLADGPGLGWSYYAYKTSWLVACCLVWVPLVPLAAAAARWATPDAGAAGRRLTAVRTAGVAAAAAAVALAVGNATAAPEPLFAAARGWASPSAQAVGDAVEAADRGGPFVFWAWSDIGNDRLANFWAALAWSTDDDGLWIANPAAEQSFAVWGYFADGATTSMLCDLVLAEPDITVYTRDADLDLDLEASCPGADPDIVVGD